MIFMGYRVTVGVVRELARSWGLKTHFAPGFWAGTGRISDFLYGAAQLRRRMWTGMAGRGDLTADR
jgi:hypothetical protein